MSVQRALGDRLYGFEDVARWLPLIGQGDVNLEMRLGAAHGQSLDRHSGAPGLCQQHIGTSERSSVAIVHDDVTGSRSLADQPFRWHAPERLAAGPAPGIERFELEFGAPGAARHG